MCNLNEFSFGTLWLMFAFFRVLFGREGVPGAGCARPICCVAGRGTNLLTRRADSAFTTAPASCSRAIYAIARHEVFSILDVHVVPMIPVRWITYFDFVVYHIVRTA